MNDRDKTTTWQQQKKIGAIAAIILILYATFDISRNVNSTSSTKTIPHNSSNFWTQLTESMKSIYNVMSIVLHLKNDGTLAEIGRMTNNHEDDSDVVIVKNVKIPNAQPIFCGQKIRASITTHNEDGKSFLQDINFTLGDKTISNALSAAMCSVRVGEAAKISMPKTHSRNKSSQLRIWHEIKILHAEPNLSMPLFQTIHQEKGSGSRAYCGSIVKVKYITYDIDGNVLQKERMVKEFAIGFGDAPSIVERAVTNAQVGDNIKIIGSKKVFFGFDFYRNMNTSAMQSWLNSIEINDDKAIVMDLTVDNIVN